MKIIVIFSLCSIFVQIQAFTDVDSADQEEYLLDALGIHVNDVNNEFDRSFYIPEQSNDGFVFTQADKDLIKKYAPLVRLAKNEEWKPSSVDFFLKEVNLVDGKNQKPVTPSSLTTCNSNCYLKTKTSLSCASCREPSVFRGQDPSQTSVPVYTIVNKHGNIMDAYLWFFYPYNRGKRVCIGVYANNVCICGAFWGHCLCPRIRGCVGGYSTFGHHVGDWEHVVLRFKDSKIYSIFLSIHDSKTTNEYGGEMLWKNGKFQQGTKSLKMQGTHPIVYSADGSHGLWPNIGRNVYKKLPNFDTLVDYTSSGKAWKTWENLHFIKYRQSGYTGKWSWLNFEGRWGNRKRSCGIAEYISGQCILNNGPSGPNRGGIGEGKLIK